jgi:Protein of unknown function (DUF1640)
MTSLRLTFLYPHLFRSIRVSEPATRTARRCSIPSTSQRASFATTSGNQQHFVERHGKAVEPFLQPGEAKEDTKVFVSESTSEAGKEPNAKSRKKPESKQESSKEKSIAPEQVQASSSTPLPQITQAAGRIPSDLDPSGGQKTLQQQGDALPQAPQCETAPPKDGPLRQVLSIELPVEPKPEDLHIPHLHPPQYVHNFDTWTLVKEVEKGGFTNKQAISAMKAVRVLLAKNLEVAKEGLVSKSDVENVCFTTRYRLPFNGTPILIIKKETYLFRAACSELCTEIQNTRRASDENMRRERTLVQHEVDILNQKLTQELLTLKDELTGMFNDRKMAVRMDQRAMDSAVSPSPFTFPFLMFPFRIPSKKVILTLGPDPRTQLQNNRSTKFRFQIRSGRPSLGVDSSCCNSPCLHGSHGAG